MKKEKQILALMAFVCATISTGCGHKHGMAAHASGHSHQVVGHHGKGAKAVQETHFSTHRQTTVPKAHSCTAF